MRAPAITADRILGWLRRQGEATAAECVAMFGKRGRSTINRLAHEGKCDRVAVGLYRAKAER